MQGRVLRVVLLLLASSSLLVSCVSNAPTPSEKDVLVTLHASWGATGMLEEAAEFLAQPGAAAFWRFVELAPEFACAPEPGSACSDESLYQAMLAAVSDDDALCPGQCGAFLNLALSAHTGNPRVEANRAAYLEDLYADQGPDAVATACFPMAVVAGRTFCDTKSLSEHLNSHPDVRAVDVRAAVAAGHVFPGPVSMQRPAVVLYATLRHAAFPRWHTMLARAAARGGGAYVLRLAVDPADTAARQARVPLQGYGVELAIKSMEYKALDDDAAADTGAADAAASGSAGADAGAVAASQVEGDAEHRQDMAELAGPILSGEGDHTLPEDLRSDLGLQAVQQLMLASDPIRFVRDLSQNFPAYAAGLAQVEVRDDVKRSVGDVARSLGQGQSYIILNGRVMDPAQVETFELLQQLQDEVTLAQTMARLGVSDDAAHHLLLTKRHAEDAAGSVAVDVRQGVRWLNDCSDTNYAMFPSDYWELTQQRFPGQPVFMQRNLYNLIWVLDPTTPHGLRMLNPLVSLITQRVPIHFGVVFARGSGTLEDVPLEVFYWMMDDRSMMDVARWLGNLIDNAVRRGMPVTEAVISSLEPFMGGKRKNVERFLARLKGAKSSSDKHLRKLVAAAKRVVDDQGIPLGSLLVNGRVRSADIRSDMELHRELMRECDYARDAYDRRAINPDIDYYDWLLQQDGVQAVYEPRLFQDVRFAGLAHLPPSLTWIHAEDTEIDIKPMSHILVVDVGTAVGRDLLRNVAQHLRDTAVDAQSRAAVIHNAAPATYSTPGPAMLLRYLQHAAQLPSQHGIDALVAGLDALLDKDKDSTAVLHDANVLRDALLPLMDRFAFPADAKVAVATGLPDDVPRDDVAADQAWVWAQLGLAAGEQALVTNGRVFTLASEQRPITPAFLSLLESLEADARANDVVRELVRPGTVALRTQHDADARSDQVMQVTSLVGLDQTSGVRRFKIPRFDARHCSRSYTRGSAIHITAILDPLSASAQRMASLLLLIRDRFSWDLDLVFNPMHKLSDMPLKRYYRYLLAPDLHFDPDTGRRIDDAALRVSGLPIGVTMTLALDAPRAWHAEATHTAYDLDNIRMEQVVAHAQLDAEFTLQHLLVTGSCTEELTDAPVQGLQLQLGTRMDPHIADTLVMLNLGYFQLKTKPGIACVSVLPGRSAELYTLTTGQQQEQHCFPVDSFAGASQDLSVSKRAGKEGETILVDAQALAQDAARSESSNSDSLSSRAKGWFSKLVGNGGGGSDDVAQDASQDLEAATELPTINVMSVASGHLYERFLRIMMLSVMRHTRAPVKFWFIGNFLSPRMKELLPVMAKAYNFKYELVTYKWPEWLRYQSEKQRLIWGYKILFLDVLFPMDVERIIFVDADQIVRSDLLELATMDLHGAPVAYTPFCDDRPEMDGYRFWKTGFWQQHLAGKPYHISALYVVDLQRFRLMAAGDLYRSVYEALTRDPGSLANLDQDLPNYMQAQVPIHSLPQHWLWCETWCSDASKEQAKTIDLCNNPMTKTPKLDNARRIVPEWQRYDVEIKRLVATVPEFLDLRYETDA